MNSTEVKKLIIDSLDENANAADYALLLAKEGAVYRFSDKFETGILNKIAASAALHGKNDFAVNLDYMFKRIALTGIAAIILLMISIFIGNGGSLSFNSLLGLHNIADESFLYLLSGY